MFTVTYFKDSAHGKSYDFQTEEEARKYFISKCQYVKNGVLFLIDNIRHELIQTSDYAMAF